MALFKNYIVGYLPPLHISFELNFTLVKAPALIGQVFQLTESYNHGNISYSSITYQKHLKEFMACGNVNLVIYQNDKCTISLAPELEIFFQLPFSISSFSNSRILSQYSLLTPVGKAMEITEIIQEKCFSIVFHQEGKSSTSLNNHQLIFLCLLYSFVFIRARVLLSTGLTYNLQ